MGALSLALVDRVRYASEEAARLTAAAPAALVALHEFLGGGSMDQLRKVLGLAPSGAVRLVDRLVAEGFVERRPGPDRRSLALVLTARGRQAARRVLIARSHALDGVLCELTDDERASLAPMAEKLLRAVTLERLADREAGREPQGSPRAGGCADYVISLPAVVPAALAPQRASPPKVSNRPSPTSATIFLAARNAVGRDPIGVP